MQATFADVMQMVMFQTALFQVKLAITLQSAYELIHVQEYRLKYDYCGKGEKRIDFLWKKAPSGNHLYFLAWMKGSFRTLFPVIANGIDGIE